MGKKANPFAVRLGIKEYWRNIWNSNNETEESRYIYMSHFIRSVLATYLKSSPISQISLAFATLKRCNVMIITKDESFFLSNRSEFLNKMRSNLEKKMLNDNIETWKGFQITFTVVGEKYNFLSPTIIANNIANGLEKNIDFRRMFNNFVNIAKRHNILGLKIEVKGRIQGNKMSRKEQIMYGKLPLSTLDCRIDYGFAEAYSKKFGTIGVKVYVCNYHLQNQNLDTLSFNSSKQLKLLTDAEQVVEQQ